MVVSLVVDVTVKLAGKDPSAIFVHLIVKFPIVMVMVGVIMVFAIVCLDSRVKTVRLPTVWILVAPLMVLASMVLVGVKWAGKESTVPK